MWPETKLAVTEAPADDAVVAVVSVMPAKSLNLDCVNDVPSELKDETATEDDCVSLYDHMANLS